jgi:hypothetical protein
MRCEITTSAFKRLFDGAVIDGLSIRCHAGATWERRERDVVREVFVDLRRLAGHRLLGVDHRWQRIVCDDNRVGRVASDVPIRGDHNGDWLARKAHDVDGNCAMLGRGKRCADRHRSKELCQLLAGEHRFDSVHRFCGAGVDRCDAAVRDIAALEGHVLHSDDLHVVNVGAQALDEARVFASFDALTNQLRQYRSRHDYLLPAAYCTALTMC